MKTLIKLAFFAGLSCISAYGQQFAFPAAGQSFNTGGRIELNESDDAAIERLITSPSDIKVGAKSVGCSTTGCTITCTARCTTNCTTNCSRLNSTEEVTVEVRSIGCSTGCSTSCSTSCSTNCSTSCSTRCSR